MNTLQEMKEIIDAAMAGKTIEYESFKGWRELQDENAHFNFTRFTYRIKPEPKPDVVVRIKTIEQGGLFVFNSVREVVGANLQLTFSGETGELKSAEVLK